MNKPGPGEAKVAVETGEKLSPQELLVRGLEFTRNATIITDESFPIKGAHLAYVLQQLGESGNKARAGIEALTLLEIRHSPVLEGEEIELKVFGASKERPFQHPTDFGPIQETIYLPFNEELGE